MAKPEIQRRNQTDTVCSQTPAAISGNYYVLYSCTPSTKKSTGVGAKWSWEQLFTILQAPPPQCRQKCQPQMTKQTFSIQNNFDNKGDL
jgi:hypothetical protein